MQQSRALSSRRLSFSLLKRSGDSQSSCKKPLKRVSYNRKGKEEAELKKAVEDNLYLIKVVEAERQQRRLCEQALEQRKSLLSQEETRAVMQETFQKCKQMLKNKGRKVDCGMNTEHWQDKGRKNSHMRLQSFTTISIQPRRPQFDWLTHSKFFNPLKTPNESLSQKSESQVVDELKRAQAIVLSDFSHRCTRFRPGSQFNLVQQRSSTFYPTSLYNFYVGRQQTRKRLDTVRTVAVQIEGRNSYSGFQSRITELQRQLSKAALQLAVQQQRGESSERQCELLSQRLLQTLAREEQQILELQASRERELELHRRVYDMSRLALSEDLH